VAQLFQSEFTEIKNRRGVQDLNNLLEILDLDGSVEVVADPTEDEIRAAREQAASDAEAAQKEAEAAGEAAAQETEAAQKKAAERAKTQRTAALPVAEDNPPPVVVEESAEEEEEGDGRKRARKT
jgi:hypothetical protein